MINKRNIIVGAVLCLIILGWIGFANRASQPVNVSSERGSAQELYKQAVSFKETGDLLKAKGLYQKILSDYPDYENIELIQKELEDVNMRVIFSNVVTPQTMIYEVKSGDTLGKLAKKYGTTVDLIKRSNHLKGDVIRIGQRLRIWTGKFNILVDKSQNILILRNGNEVLKVYTVSTGKNNSTPVGHFKIVSKLIDPVWFVPGAIIPPESPQNVLGSRWLGFDKRGYGIHGTVEPETIGRQMTAGCVRMRNKDVEELYSILPIGTSVEVVD